MIKFTLKEPLSFIRKTANGEDVTTGYAEKLQHVYKITSGGFAQIISSKQYAKLLEAATVNQSEPVAPVSEPPQAPAGGTEDGKGTTTKVKGSGTRRK